VSAGSCAGGSGGGGTGSADGILGMDTVSPIPAKF
jgi:hypothetical protein